MLKRLLLFCSVDRSVRHRCRSVRAYGLCLPAGVQELLQRGRQLRWCRSSAVPAQRLRAARRPIPFPVRREGPAHKRHQEPTRTERRPW